MFLTKYRTLTNECMDDMDSIIRTVHVKESVWEKINTLKEYSRCFNNLYVNIQTISIIKKDVGMLITIFKLHIQSGLYIDYEVFNDFFEKNYKLFYISLLKTLDFLDIKKGKPIHTLDIKYLINNIYGEPPYKYVFTKHRKDFLKLLNHKNSNCLNPLNTINFIMRKYCVFILNNHINCDIVYKLTEYYNELDEHVYESCKRDRDLFDSAFWYSSIPMSESLKIVFKLKYFDIIKYNPSIFLKFNDMCRNFGEETVYKKYGFNDTNAATQLIKVMIDCLWRGYFKKYYYLLENSNDYEILNN